MSGWLQDFRYALRRLSSAPGFTVAVTLILGLGIGANSALFTALDRMIVRPLPYLNPNQLVMMREDFSAFGSAKNRVSPATFLDWWDRARSFEDIAAYAGPRVRNFADSGAPEEILGQGVTPALLPMLGVPPLIGRTISAGEDRPGVNVMVLSYSLWMRRFSGDRSVVGRTIRMSGEKYDVIGVMPKGFQFPDRQTEFWIPLGLNPDVAARRNSHFLYVVGRLRPGRNIQQGQEDMTGIAQALAREFPATNARVGITVASLKDEFLGETRSTLILLLASAGCVLLIACANVANLMLAKSAARQKEVAVRTALGGSPARVLRQILTENALLSLAGGGAGLLFAKWIMVRLEVMIPPAIAGTVDLRLDLRAIAITAGIAILTSLMFGLAPSLRLRRTGILESLNHAGRGSIGQPGSRLHDVLVVAEIGIALTLVIGAVLLVQTLSRLRSFDAGFKSDGILTAHINVSTAAYADALKRQLFYTQVLDRVKAIPGVKSLGLTSDLPYTSRGNTMSLRIEGIERQPGLGTDVLFRLVSAGYLETMRGRLIEGRLLESRDVMDTVPVVVVNETLVRQY